MSSCLASEATSADWFAVLCKIDDDLSARPSAGLTTGIVAFIDADRIRGASVGDSSAWLVSPSTGIADLTARQRRRPLIGTGEALPVTFEAARRMDRILLASDGLIKYAPPERICTPINSSSVASAIDSLIDCVRLPSGALHDDVAVVIVGP